MLSAVFKYCLITLLILPLVLTASDTGHYFSKLKTAVSNNELETVHQLLLQNTTDWLTAARGWEIARIAAENGNLRVIEYIGERKLSILGKKNKKGETIGHIAAENGNLRVIEYICERNLSILGKKNKKGETIGHIAAEHGHPNITEYFLKKWRYCSTLKLSDSEKASLFDLVAKKGYLNCISNTIMSPDDAEYIGRIAADNGHLGIACCMALRGDSLHGMEICSFIKTALEKSRKVDPETLELFGELAEQWHLVHHPDVIELAASANRIDLIQYLAEKRCDCFLRKYHSSKDLRIAFEKNLVNQRFLECLEKANGTVLGYIDKSIETSVETICHVAAQYGRLDVIRLMTEKNSSVLEAASWKGKTVVTIAAEKGHADIVRYVVRQNPFSSSWYDSHGRGRYPIAFHFAIAKNFIDMDTLKYMVEKYSSLVMRISPENGRTAAHMAAASGNMDILRYLVKEEPSLLSIADSRGDTILHILAENNNLTGNEFEFFVDKGARIPAKNCHQQTVGHIAAKSGNVELLQYLTKKEPSILSASDDHGDTILHILAEHNALSKEGLAFFMDHGAPVDAENAFGQTVGHILARNARTDSLEYLVERSPAILNIQDEDADTVLHLLARKNALRVKNLEFFAEKGASFILKNYRGENIALLAAINGNSEILRCVVKKEPAVLTGNASVGDKIVVVAIRHCYSNILELIAEEGPTLLAYRPNILFRLANSSEVLGVLRRLKAACETRITHWDRRHFENEVLRQILVYDYANIFEFTGYDEDMVIDQGEPLIFTIVRRNRSNLFHYLAENRRTNLTALDREGNNILFIAAMRHDLKKMRYILDTLKTPIDIEWRNYVGNTLLHVSVHEALHQVDKARDVYQFQEELQNAMDVIKYLVEEKHARVNARGPNNKTALHWATSRANFDISNYLLNHGADPKL